jgi:hypothetical protein
MKSCKSLLKFLTTSWLRTQDFRVELVRQAQERWTGKRVRFGQNHSRFGQVEFITARTQKDWGRTNHNPVSHLAAYVRINPNQGMYIPVDTIIAVESP